MQINAPPNAAVQIERPIIRRTAMSSIARSAAAVVFSAMLAGASGAAYAGAGHSSNDDGHKSPSTMESTMVDSMREMHRSHVHDNDFEVMEEMRPEQMALVIESMRDVGLVLPPMDPARGRELFVTTGCVACHSVNGVGGDVGPAMDAAEMPAPMNVFEFAARMWRGAAAMTVMQEEELGGVIDLTGQDLADLIAFAHDAEEQAELTENQIPERFRKMLAW